MRCSQAGQGLVGRGDVMRGQAHHPSGVAMGELHDTEEGGNGRCVLGGGGGQGRLQPARGLIAPQQQLSLSGRPIKRFSRSAS